MKTHSFCESMHAAPLSPWHIRKLSSAGQKLGGGADTNAMCGRTVAWDLDVDITPHHLRNNTCQACREAYCTRSKDEEAAK